MSRKIKAFEERTGQEWKLWKPKPRATAKLGQTVLTVEATRLLVLLNKPEHGADGLHESVLYEHIKGLGLRVTIEPLEELNRAGFMENPPDAKLGGNPNVRKWRLTPSGQAMARAAEEWAKKTDDTHSERERALLK